MNTIDQNPSLLKLQRTVNTCYRRSYDVRVVHNMLEDKISELLPHLEGRRVLLVTRSPVDELYTQQIHDILREHNVPTALHIVDCTEQHKTLASVEKVCAAARDYNLGRKDVLLSVGGGICTDIVTVAASWIRRGIGYICIPTTLICQIDAGIGIKGAVNFQGKKSYLGSFYPPELVMIDPSFLKTLPAAEVICGFAEILKMAIVRDKTLFGLVEKHAKTLLDSTFQTPHDIATEIIWRSTLRMLEELESNIYEDQTYRRLVDFGHTFSPLLEATRDFEIPHGEAVAIDIAFSATLANRLGLIDESTHNRMIDTLESCELPVFSDYLTVELCQSALDEALNHRGGAVNLVLPSGIGEAQFIEHRDVISNELLSEGLDWLSSRSSRHRIVVDQQPASLVYDVGGTNMRVAIYDPATNSLSARLTRPTPNYISNAGLSNQSIYLKLLEVMVAAGNELLGTMQPVSVSIAFPGPIDSTGWVMAAPTIFGRPLEGPLNPVGDLQASWKHARCYVMNDVTAAGYRYLADAKDNMCIFTIGSGIGNKVFIEGKPFVGPSGLGGELGHFRVDFDDDAIACDCGGQGHLGAIASGRGALRMARRLAEGDSVAFNASKLAAYCSGEISEMTNEHIVLAFHEADLWTHDVLRIITKPLGQTIASLHAALGLERFWIYGGFGLALGERYRKIVVEIARNSVWDVGKDWNSMIQLGENDDDSGLIGAGRYAQHFV